MSDTPLRQASLRAIAEELLRREQGEPAAPVPVDPPTGGDGQSGVRKGHQRRQARPQERG